MKKWLGFAIAGLFAWSCSNSGNDYKIGKQTSIDKILQEKDGTIALDVEQAATYSDMSNPSDNTAEWNVLVSKKGRYNVWLSSYTKDSTNLNYQDSVRVSIEDNKSLKAIPSVDRVIKNSTDGPMPFKADSFLGSVVIPDTGLVSIQVVSEKIIPKEKSSGNEDSKLVSIILTPERNNQGM
jgi:hypothetical protein